jgi:hypothetical protein
MMASLVAPLPPVTLDDVLAACGGRRTSPDRGVGFCPAHDDRGSPSLSVREGGDGKLLFHCFGGGCAFHDILDSLGLAPCQVFPSAPPAYRRPRRVRRDPDRNFRELCKALLRVGHAPATGQLWAELRVLGEILLSGTRTRLPRVRFQMVPLRLLYEATVEMHRQGTPRRWLSRLALARDIDRAAGRFGYARERGLLFWARQAVAEAVWGRRQDGRL